MGFFDSLLGRKPSPFVAPAAPPPAAAARPAEPPADADAGSPFGDAISGQGEVRVQQSDELRLAVAEALAQAREFLDRQDLPSALHLYEQVLQSETELADPLATISGDLGATGNLGAMIELVAPVYDPARHGAAAGINLLQAYLHLRNDAAAQQLLDLLDTLHEPGLRDRLDGLRGALQQLRGEVAAEALQAPPSDAANVSLATISKPIWTYGLPEGENCLPTKHGRERHIAFMPIALVGEGVEKNQPAPPTHPLAPLARALPLALAEYCWFSPDYQPVAVVGVDPAKHVFLAPRAFGGEQARDLLTKDRRELIGHAISGTLCAGPGGTIAAAELTIWDTRKARAVTTLRAEGAGALLAVWQKLLGPVKLGPAPIDYAPPADPVAHTIALDHAVHFFLAAKQVLPVGHIDAPADRLRALFQYADTHTGLVPRLVCLGALQQATALGLEVPPEIAAAVAAWSGP